MKMSDLGEIKRDIRNPLSREKVTRLDAIFSEIISRDRTTIVQSTFADNSQRSAHDVVSRDGCRPPRAFCHDGASSQRQRVCSSLGTSLFCIVSEVVADELQAVRRDSSWVGMAVAQGLPGYSLSREEEQRRKNEVLQMHRWWYLEEWEFLNLKRPQHLYYKGPGSGKHLNVTSSTMLKRTS